jgi:hypothetical protein
MIYVMLKDGTRRRLDEAEVLLVWDGEGGGEDTYTIDDVSNFLFIEPMIDLSAGNVGGMPVVGMKMADLSDVVVETVMPTPFAREFSGELETKATAAEDMAHKAAEVARRGSIETGQSLVDVGRIYGGPPTEKMDGGA